jgi:arsenate reductase
MKIYCHPRCGTCKKALKFLDENNVQYEYINLLEVTPTIDEIKKAYKNSGVPLKKLFNTSGKLYRELEMKDKVAGMTEDEVFELLSNEGMLIKRPMVIKGDLSSFGFNEEEFNKYL